MSAAKRYYRPFLSSNQLQSDSRFLISRFSLFLFVPCVRLSYIKMTTDMEKQWQNCADLLPRAADLNPLRSNDVVNVPIPILYRSPTLCFSFYLFSSLSISSAYFFGYKRLTLNIWSDWFECARICPKTKVIKRSRAIFLIWWLVKNGLVVNTADESVA